MIKYLPKEESFMPKFFIKNDQLKDDEIVILGEDVKHISNVLRMKIDDIIQVCNTDTTENFNVRLKAFDKDRIVGVIEEKIKSEAESNINLKIFQGIPKSDKMELIIQKSVELGVNKITPIEMKRCVVKLDGKDKTKKVERWQKIAEVAAKQSGRDIIPEICQIKSVKEISESFSEYDLVLLCYENEKDTFIKDVLKNDDLIKKSENKNEIKIAVIIGPEGGIDISEVEYMKQNGAKVISLGNRILRTETVAISLLSIIMYEFERNGK